LPRSCAAMPGTWASLRSTSRWSPWRFFWKALARA